MTKEKWLEVSKNKYILWNSSLLIGKCVCLESTMSILGIVPLTALKIEDKYKTHSHQQLKRHGVSWRSTQLKWVNIEMPEWKLGEEKKSKTRSKRCIFTFSNSTNHFSHQNVRLYVAFSPSLTLTFCTKPSRYVSVSQIWSRIAVLSSAHNKRTTFLSEFCRKILNTPPKTHTLNLAARLDTHRDTLIPFLWLSTVYIRHRCSNPYHLLSLFSPCAWARAVGASGCIMRSSNYLYTHTNTHDTQTHARTHIRVFPSLPLHMTLAMKAFGWVIKNDCNSTIPHLRCSHKD